MSDTPTLPDGWAAITRPRGSWYRVGVPEAEGSVLAYPTDGASLGEIELAIPEVLNAAGARALAARLVEAAALVEHVPPATCWLDCCGHFGGTCVVAGRCCCGDSRRRASPHTSSIRRPPVMTASVAPAANVAPAAASVVSACPDCTAGAIRVPGTSGATFDCASCGGTGLVLLPPGGGA